MQTHDSLFTILSYLHNAWALNLPEQYKVQVAKLTSTAAVVVEVK